MTGSPLGRRGLDRLRAEMSERDMAVIASVDQFRFLSTRQIEQLHFREHASDLAGARSTRRTLERLSNHHALVRLERRIGGLRAGSASYIYGLGAIGDRLLGIDGPRRRFREPTTHFLDHTLAIAQLVIDLNRAHRTGEIELLGFETEPTCWRTFQNGLSGNETLRPDLFVALGLGEFEHRWFIEIDRGTEATTTVIRKCRVYDDYRRTGNEQSQHGVFPKVLWITPDDRRRNQIERAITTTARLSRDLFVTTTNAAALDSLCSNEPEGPHSNSNGRR